ncbi:hypothetical protein L873DRAFT_1803291 [Choiromyces venosus 120613-1]|uniref:Uncharacterized protein n=1 Tax=Choiromyces venosus 120613-1 TaxID=1336337 RepID=A0A3N4JT90_9PEZI|nr:hypothetical protein L873DRAFT_1803291 [Choiromyces venosus 120613-1]
MVYVQRVHLYRTVPHPSITPGENKEETRKKKLPPKKRKEKRRKFIKGDCIS